MIDILTLTTGNWIAIASIASVIVLAILGGIGRMLYKQGGLDTTVINLDKKFDRLDEKFDKYIMYPLARGKSPITLTEKGYKLFNQPFIQEFVKKNLDVIIDDVKSYKIRSAYQAQEVLFDVVSKYKTHPSYQFGLEDVAFSSSEHIDILMKVISIGIRDDVFKHLIFKVDQIDNEDPSEKNSKKD